MRIANLIGDQRWRPALTAGLLVSVFVVDACGSKRRRRPIGDDAPLRSGEEIPFEQTKFFDGKASVSSDGKRVVFISGRDGNLKAYRFNRDNSQLARVSRTDADLGTEMEAAISPSGNLILLLAAKSGSVDVYVRGFDGTANETKLPDSLGEVESFISFSPDSQLCAFLRRDKNTGRSHLYVGKMTATGFEGTLTKISADTDDETTPVWVPQSTAGSYQIVTRPLRTANYKATLTSRLLSTASGISVTSKRTLVEGLNMKSDVSMVGTTRGLFFAVPNPAGAGRREAIAPVGNEPTDLTRVAMQNIAQIFDVASLNVANLGSPGFEVLNYSLNTAGTFGAMAIREAFACMDNGAKQPIDYGVSMVIFDNNAGANKFTRLVPLSATEANKYAKATDICIRKRSDNTDGALNRKITRALVNSAASTNSDYTLVYETYVSGDFEVHMFVVSGTTATFYDVSNNRKS